MAAANEMDGYSLEEELELLKAIYIHELTIEGTRERASSVSLLLHPSTADEGDKQYVCLTLDIMLPEQYPEILPSIQITNPRGLSDAHTESISMNLHELAESRLGSPMLYELIEYAKECLTDNNIPSCACAICLCHFQDHHSFTKTECYHYFHCSCLARYIEYTLKKIDNHDDDDNNKYDDDDDTSKVVCPMCRLPIVYDLEALRAAPVEDTTMEEVIYKPDAKMKKLQQKMASLYEEQYRKGGIIDIEQEKNKYLIGIKSTSSTTGIPEEPSSEEPTSEDAHPSAVPLSVVINTTDKQTQRDAPKDATKDATNYDKEGPRDARDRPASGRGNNRTGWRGRGGRYEGRSGNGARRDGGGNRSWRNDNRQNYGERRNARERVQKEKGKFDDGRSLREEEKTSENKDFADAKPEPKSKNNFEEASEITKSRGNGAGTSHGNEETNEVKVDMGEKARREVGGEPSEANQRGESRENINKEISTSSDKGSQPAAESEAKRSACSKEKRDGYARQSPKVSREGGRGRRKEGEDTRKEGGERRKEVGDRRKEGEERGSKYEDTRKDGGERRKEGGDGWNEGGDRRKEVGVRRKEGGDRRNEGRDRRKEGGDRRKEGGDGRNEGGDRRKEGRDRRNEGGDRRKEGGDRRNEGGDRRSEGGDRRKEGGDRRNEGGDRRKEDGDRGSKYEDRIKEGDVRPGSAKRQGAQAERKDGSKQIRDGKQIESISQAASSLGNEAKGAKDSHTSSAMLNTGTSDGYVDNKESRGVKCGSHMDAEGDQLRTSSNKNSPSTARKAPEAGDFTKASKRGKGIRGKTPRDRAQTPDSQQGIEETKSQKDGHCRMNPKGDEISDCIVKCKQESDKSKQTFTERKPFVRPPPGFEGRLGQSGGGDVGKNVRGPPPGFEGKPHCRLPPGFGNSEWPELGTN